jgi:hypothetical protein
LILICGIDNRFSLYEELTSVWSLYGTTTGKDLFMKVKETLTSLGLKWGTLKSVTADSAKNVCGCRTGVVCHIISELMQENSVSLMMFHCIIHQQVICSKVLRWEIPSWRS